MADRIADHRRTNLTTFRAVYDSASVRGDSRRSFTFLAPERDNGDFQPRSRHQVRRRVLVDLIAQSRPAVIDASRHHTIEVVCSKPVRQEAPNVANRSNRISGHSSATPSRG